MNEQPGVTGIEIIFHIYILIEMVLNYKLVHVDIDYRGYFCIIMYNGESFLSYLCLSVINTHQR